MKPKKYFSRRPFAMQKRYEALRQHFVEGISLSTLAKELKLSNSYLKKEKTRVVSALQNNIDPYFLERKTGPKTKHKADAVKDKVLALRVQNFSIIDIKASLESCGEVVSLGTINSILKMEGFERLSRRTSIQRNQLKVPNKFSTPRSSKMAFKVEEFSTGRSGGVLAFLPIIEDLGIIPAIKKSGFPETSNISAVSYVLSFLVLKLIGNNRLSHDESWSLDRVLGMFAGLNVLPKSASLSSYSYRVSRECNRNFLLKLNQIFNTSQDGLCEFNLDFKTIPHWGDESILEKNYSTMRGKAVKSVLALIVQNITSENLAYTNAEITHENEKNCVIEFVDFWKESTGTSPKMLIFDQQFPLGI